MDLNGDIKMINSYSKPIGNTLEQYVPLPLSEIYKAGEAIQQRGDKIESINDQFQSGLASLEALAPAQKAYVQNYANQYRDEQNKLLTQYGGNASDPEYARKSRQLISRYASDPNLKIIQETNSLYKQKRDLATQLQANGKKYIDSNPTFTGRDSQGNLISNVGQLQGTNFDDSILKKFQIQGERMEQFGAMKSSKGNIQRQQHQYIRALNGEVHDDDINEGLRYYKQQGLSDDQAKLAMAQLIRSGSDYVKSDLDTGYLNWEESRAARLAANQPAQGPTFEVTSYPKTLVPDGSTVRNTQSAAVEGLLRDLDDKGNLKTSARDVADNPQNRAAFPNATPLVRSSSVGVGGVSSANVLSVPQGSDPNQESLLATARQLTGMKKGTAKDVLTKYKSLMNNFDQSSQQILNSDNTKLQDQLASTVKHQIGTGEVYKINKGKLEIVTDSKELAKLEDVKTDNISGISPKTINDGTTSINGYAQFSKDGNIYYTRTPKEWQKKFEGSNTVSQYLQDFDASNLQKTRLNDGSEVFINPKSLANPTPYTYAGRQGYIIPYKGNNGNNLVGGAIFTSRDPKTGQAVDMYLPISKLENNEVRSLFSNTLNNNK